VHFDKFANDAVIGWAYDEDDALTATVLHIKIDGAAAGSIRCDLPRPDVRQSGHASAHVGFAFPIPAAFMDGKVHSIAFSGAEGGETFLLPNDAVIGNKISFMSNPITFVGQVDGFGDGTIRGWAFAHDRSSGTKIGAQQILIFSRGAPVFQLKADQFRPDVATAFDADPNCGFSFSVPRALMISNPVELQFKIAYTNYELKNSPYSLVLLDADIVVSLQNVSAQVDRLFSQMWQLRRSIQGLIPADTHTIESYDHWAQQYFNALENEMASSGALQDMKQHPLISIICPTYRPRYPDFIAAVQSVIAQTYAHWEMIIVDDASADENLTDLIADFAAGDKRIKAISRRENGGISNATNDALAAAKGKYIAFFDHDDLLVPQALEVMLLAALGSGAKLLYCDEDKINDEGVFSDLNLKPDWNYRLLLSQNYICHLLFVEAALIRSVGLLRTACDGAQDHDMIIRLTERLTDREICHVPEILYHWRKTPTSTAQSGKSKP